VTTTNTAPHTAPDTTPPGAYVYSGTIRAASVPAIRQLVADTATKLGRRVPGVKFHLSELPEPNDVPWCLAHRAFECDEHRNPEAAPCRTAPARPVQVIVYAEGLPAFDGDWSVAGSLTTDTEGVVTGHTIAERDWVTTEHRALAGDCRHCGKSRRRSVTVLLRHATTGEVRPVGRTCLAEYTGGMIRVAMLAGLIGLGERFALAVADMVATGPESAPTLEVVAHARCIIEAHGYIRSGYGSTREPDTRTRLGHAVCASQDPTSARAFATGVVALTEDQLARAREDITLVLAAPTDGDYMANLRAVAGADHVQVTGRASRLGLLASLPGAADRVRRDAQAADRVRQAVEALDALPNEWIGTVGELVEVAGELVFARIMDRFYGGTVLLKFQTSEGVVKMFTTRKGLVDLEVGAQVTVRGTVKEHDVYNDRRETLLARPTLG